MKKSKLKVFPTPPPPPPPAAAAATTTATLAVPWSGLRRRQNYSPSKRPCLKQSCYASEQCLEFAFPFDKKTIQNHQILRRVPQVLPEPVQVPRFGLVPVVGDALLREDPAVEGDIAGAPGVKGGAEAWGNGGEL